MDIKGKHVAILVHNYFEQAEFEEPISDLKDAGAEVTVITNDKRQLQGLNNVKFGDKFEADLLLSQASGDDFDAIILPGGVFNADILRTDIKAQEFVLDFLDSGKPTALICHASWVLVSADAVEGRRLTSYFTLRDDIFNAGGDWVDLPVVVDDNLITSRNPDDLPYFNDQIIALLNQQSGSVEEDSASGNFVDKSEAQTTRNYRLRSLGYSKSDKLSKEEQRDILRDEDDDLDDEEAFHPSSMIPVEDEE